jgi:hypothetical protein
LWFSESGELHGFPFGEVGDIPRLPNEMRDANRSEMADERRGAWVLCGRLRIAM